MTALNMPWTKRVNSVSPAARCTRSIPQPQASNAAAPDDQERPHTALDAHGGDARRTITNLRRTGRLKQVVDAAPDHGVGQRQGE